MRSINFLLTYLLTYRVQALSTVGDSRGCVCMSIRLLWFSSSPVFQLMTVNCLAVHGSMLSQAAQLSRIPSVSI